MCRADFHHCSVMELTCVEESERQFGFVHAILLCGDTIQVYDVIQLPLPPFSGGGICVFCMMTNEIRIWLNRINLLIVCGLTRNYDL